MRRTSKRRSVEPGPIGLLGCAVLLAFACRTSHSQSGADAASVDGRVSTDGTGASLMPVGTAQTLDIATWNIENFPRRSSTPDRVADIITSLALDLVAVQEIADVAAFDELMALLPGYDSVLSDHTYSSGAYQKIGFLYRADLLAASDATLLFSENSYGFPRPPLQVSFAVNQDRGAPLTFIAIALHLKAGGDDSDVQRRQHAIEELDAHVRQLAVGSDDDVIVLGDFNEDHATVRGSAVWAPFLDDDYRVHITELGSNSVSFLPGGSSLDHVVSTIALGDEFAGNPAVIPRLDHVVSRYESAVSDHLPVIAIMPAIFDSSP